MAGRHAGPAHSRVPRSRVLPRRSTLRQAQKRLYARSGRYLTIFAGHVAPGAGGRAARWRRSGDSVRADASAHQWAPSGAKSRRAQILEPGAHIRGVWDPKAGVSSECLLQWWQGVAEAVFCVLVAALPEQDCREVCPAQSLHRAVRPTRGRSRGLPAGGVPRAHDAPCRMTKTPRLVRGPLTVPARCTTRRSPPASGWPARRHPACPAAGRPRRVRRPTRRAGSCLARPW